MTAVSVCDATVLNDLGDQLADADGSLVTTIVATYLVEGLAAARRIEAAAEQGLPLRGPAHALRGSTLAVGGLRLAWLCEQIELGEQVVDPREAARAVRREFDLLAEHLRWRSRTGPSGLAPGGPT